MSQRRRRVPHAALLAWVVAAGCHAEGAELEVVAVTALGAIEQPATIDGRDGGTSGRFMDRSVWVYGDSVATAQGSYPSTWRNNTMSWTDDLDAADGLTGFTQPTDDLGAAREFFPRTPEEADFNDLHFDDGDGGCADPCGARYAIWGSGPLEDPERGRALLSYAKVYAEPGEFNFSLVGTSLAVWEAFDDGPGRPEVDATLEDPTLLFDAATEGEFAIPVIDGDHLFLFSCSGGPHDSHGCRLGRAPLGEVLRRDAWSFRGSSGWSSDVDDAVSLFDGSPNLTVHWNAHVERWIAIYIAWGDIETRTAPAVDGPWSHPSTIYTPDEDGAIHALGHAELQQEGGAVEYVSYLAGEFRLLRVELDPQ